MEEQNNRSIFWKILVTAILIELVIMIFIFLFDPRYCPSEDYSLKWLQALQLLLASFFAYKNFNINNGKIKTFWILISLAFLYVAIDEVFMIHERIGDLLTNTLVDKFYPYLLDSFILVVYFVIGIIFLLYFLKPFYEKYKEDSWLYLLIIALIITAYSVLADVLSYSCSEEYAEAFASLFYLLSFLFAYKTHKREKVSQNKIIK